MHNAAHSPFYFLCRRLRRVAQTFSVLTHRFIQTISFVKIHVCIPINDFDSKRVSNLTNSRRLQLFKTGINVNASNDIQRLTFYVFENFNKIDLIKDTSIYTKKNYILYMFNALKTTIELFKTFQKITFSSVLYTTKSKKY